MDVREKKKELRNRIKEINKNLTPEYCKEASARICEKVMTLDTYADAKTIFCFVGVGAEPDTRAIIEDALAKGKRVSVPLCIDKTTMEAVEITDFDRDLEAGFYGLLEPKKDLARVQPSEIDFAVIPCVSCDHKGNRLGHGRGYYDRYLEGQSFDCAMICFEKATVAEGEIPTDQYDKAIETVITDAQ